MLWEEFRSHALVLLGEHFPPELIEDNATALFSPAGVTTAATFSPRLRGESSLPTRANETQWSRSA